MKQSKYNIKVKLPNEEKYLIYNTLYKGLICIEPEFLDALENCNSKTQKQKEAIESFKEQKFIIEDEENEFEFLKYEFYKAMFDNTELVLTIAPTLACNFRCPYCYETSRSKTIDTKGIHAIVDFVIERYKENNFKKLKVNWYGGEPLLAINEIEEISKLLIEFSEKNNIEYTARMVTNGSLINENIIEILKSIKVKDIQITIDGLKENHDKRRISKDGKSTFDLIISNTKKAIKSGITVGIRMNTDEVNKDDYSKLVKIFENDKEVYVYMGHLRQYDNNLRKLEYNFFSKERFSNLEYENFEKMNRSIEDLENILECKKIFCSATIDNNFIIDEKCNVYKCWNDIGNDNRIIFNLMEKPEKREINKIELMKYMGWNPFNQKECQKCKVFPICAGGCAFETNKDKEIFCYPPKYNIEKYILKYYYELKNINKNT